MDEKKSPYRHSQSVILKSDDLPDGMDISQLPQKVSESVVKNQYLEQQGRVHKDLLYAPNKEVLLTKPERMLRVKLSLNTLKELPADVITPPSILND